MFSVSAKLSSMRTSKKAKKAKKTRNQTFSNFFWKVKISIFACDLLRLKAKVITEEVFNLSVFWTVWTMRVQKVSGEKAVFEISDLSCSEMAFWVLRILRHSLWFLIRMSDNKQKGKTFRPGCVRTCVGLSSFTFTENYLRYIFVYASPTRTHTHIPYIFL